MKQIILIITLGLIGAISSSAQKSFVKDSFYRFHVMIVPTTYATFRIPATQLSFQYRFNKDLEINQEIGWIRLDRDRYENRSGFRIRTEARIYRGPHFFVGAQFRYFRVSYDTTADAEWFGGLFNRELDYKQLDQAAGANFSLGWKFNFFGITQFETGFAFGIMNRRTRLTNIPDDAVLVDELEPSFYSVNQNDTDYSIVTPIIQFDLRFGLGFGKSAK